jgi:metal-sulfur cluster biosynthetic enzyme
MDHPEAVNAALPFPYDGPAELAQPVLNALCRVVDPEVALSIVDVGLIYGVQLQDSKARVCMTMTSAACPVTDVILDDVENQLDGVLPEDWTIEVELVWEPAWTPARMSERARRFMGW